MGTIYYARNQETKKAYELGKGAWEQISESGFIDSTNAEKLREVITTHVITYPVWARETVDDIAYHKMIAEALSRLGNRLELVNDAAWDDPTEGFDVVGTRYLGDA